MSLNVARLDEPAQGLPFAPAEVLADGRMPSGRYQGCVPRIDWSALLAAQDRPAWWLRCHHKRWVYAGLSTSELFIGLAVVDLGWASSAFAYVFDRAQRRLLADWGATGLPWLSGQVNDGALWTTQARFHSPSGRLSLRPAGDRVLQVDWRARGVSLQAELDLSRMPPSLLAIGAPAGGLAHATHKTSALPMRGWLSVRGQRLSLHAGSASIDSSNGLLARETAWRWASAHRHGLGFNLQSGYFGDQENALWLDGELIALGAARFDFDPARPLADWHIHTADGLLDLRFTPLGARSGNQHALIASSRYIQPVGLFEGTVRAWPSGPARAVKDLLGVTEDHHSRW